MYLWKYTARPARQAASNSCFVAGGSSLDSISNTGTTKTTPSLGGLWCTISIKPEASRALGNSSISDTSTRDVFATVLATFRATLIGYVILLFRLSVSACRHWRSEAAQSPWMRLITPRAGGRPAGNTRWTETCTELLSNVQLYWMRIFEYTAIYEKRAITEQKTLCCVLNTL